MGDLWSFYFCCIYFWDICHFSLTCRTLGWGLNCTFNFIYWSFTINPHSFMWPEVFGQYFHFHFGNFGEAYGGWGVCSSFHIWSTWLWKATLWDVTYVCTAGVWRAWPWRRPSRSNRPAALGSAKRRSSTKTNIWPSTMQVCKNHTRMCTQACRREKCTICAHVEYFFYCIS